MNKIKNEIKPSVKFASNFQELKACTQAKLTNK